LSPARADIVVNTKTSNSLGNVIVRYFFGLPVFN